MLHYNNKKVYNLKKSRVIMRELKKSWNDVKELKIYILIISCLMLASLVLGLIYPHFFEEEIKRVIENIIKQTENLTFPQMIVFIIQNNLTTAFIGLVVGLGFGIIPLALTLVNGYIIGFVLSKVIAIEGIISIWKIFPHGIFEIPAVIISFALGLKLGATILESKKKSILAYFLSLTTFILLISFFYLIILLILVLTNNINLENLYLNRIISIIIIIPSFILSIIIGRKFLSKEDNKNLWSKFKANIEKALRIFLYIILPLIIIAGIIESILIFLSK